MFNYTFNIQVKRTLVNPTLMPSIFVNPESPWPKGRLIKQKKHIKFEIKC